MIAALDPGCQQTEGLDSKFSIGQRLTRHHEPVFGYL